MSYIQTTPYTCGPSAYIEGFSKIKNKKVELQLNERGRIKPTKAFFGVSFLEISPKLILYTQNKPISNKFIDLAYKFENLKRKYTKKQLKMELDKNYNYLIKKHRKRIVRIKNVADIIKILMLASQKKKKALLLSHSGYWNKKEGVLHWLCFKRKNKENDFIFSDSHTGKTLKFSERDINSSLLLVKKDKFPLQIITDFRIS